MNVLWWLGVAVVSLLIVVGVGAGIRGSFNDRVVECTVVDKDRTSTREGGSDMRIYTEDCGNLTVDDLLLRGKFSSSDTYREIEPGNRYEFTIVGYRIPFLSMFPNILEVEQVN